MHLAGHMANAAGLRHLSVSDYGVRPQVFRLLVVRANVGKVARDECRLCTMGSEGYAIQDLRSVLFSYHARAL